ncbi:MAG TPA: nucleotide sugar dehydrogenase [Gemmataceae bacterium]|nr:nucleotide sugar dehydrogenase [Gemmataceae bacterium]
MMHADPPAAVELLDKIATRTARIAIVGLGYAGLPLAEVFWDAGFAILGLDIDPQRIARLRRGESYLGHFAAERVRRLLDSGRFEPSDDAGRLHMIDAAILCVPTPLTPARDPDLSAVIAAAESIARHLRPGQLIVLESTTYPGTTRTILQPLLDKSGRRCGVDFFLAYSPEREDPGNRQFTTATIPRVVGGVDTVSGRLAVALFAAAVRQVVPVSSAEVAEACKILENTYRAVNIALVNELKVLYDRMDIDICEVIDAARTKPFGFQPFWPGPGWGGHCIPIDPFYLAWVGRKFGAPARFVELAGEINTAMPAFVLAKLTDALNDRGKAVRGSRICVLGVAYKRDVDDSRESPGVELLHLLRQKGADIHYNDPHVPQLRDDRHAVYLQSEPLSEAFLRQQDGVLIAVDHSAYDWDWIVAHSPLVVDTRNATRGVTRHRERIIRA